MKYPCVRQHSQEDCGAACLATILLYYGFGVSLNRVREIVGTGSRGTTLLGLRRGAEALGFNTRQAKADLKLLDRLDKVSLPIIIHWKGNHWVALYGKKFKKYVIADPSVGIRYITRKELTDGWGNGLLLQLTLDKSRFYQQQSDKKKGFGQYLQRVLPYRNILTLAIAMNIAIGLLSLASPLMMQTLTDDVLVEGNTEFLTTVAIGAIVIKFIQSTISLIQSHLIGHFGQRLQLDLIFDYGRKLLRLPLSYFEARRSGEVVSRIKDVNSINSLVSEIVLGLPSQFFIAIVSLSFMLFYSWQLTLASVAGFVIVTLINFLFLPAIRQRTRDKIVSSTENQGFLVETFRGIQVLKTTQATPQAWQEYQRNYNRLAYLGWKTMTLSLYSNTITDVFSTVNSIGLLWFGSYLVINSTLTIGQLLAFQGMSSNFLGFLSSGVGLIDKFVNAQIVIQRLTEVIEATPEDESDFKKPDVKIPGNTDIVCSHLNFYHPGRLNLLKDFSVTIPGGKVTALIGKSGCGKSTLAKLITSLDKIQSGNISYGSYNQQDLSLKCLRQKIILVPQETHFWSRSIIENFSFSYPDISFENIVRACQIAGADEFINRLPDKYQTVLGEFGANLSGGQKQRLAIARAIITDPPILILDESTGALDPVSEAQVLNRILDYRQGKTTIIISHRPQVIKRADWIIMLEQGNLKIEGTVEDLRQTEGEHLDFIF
ncbi:MAG: peptidase domain-containing ABC transporter [Nostocaceae cyanobacterium]|nr:peptidase domain-containing ABC transporter [Nostocaceae cyanobacterium]